MNILQAVNNHKVSAKEAKQIRKVVPIEEWVNDPYYVGPPGMALYPFWKKQMIEIFKDRKDGEEINEVIIDGAIGCRPWDTSLVQTSRGLLTCQELDCYDYEFHNPVQVKTYRGVYDIEDVLKKSSSEVRTITITTDDGMEFTGTEDHRLLIRRGGKEFWIRLNECWRGDILTKERIECLFPEKRAEEGEAYFWGYYTNDVYTDNMYHENDNFMMMSIICNTESENDLYKYLNSKGIDIDIDGWTFGKKYKWYNEELKSKAKQFDFEGDILLPLFIRKYSKYDICEYLAGLWDSIGRVEKKRGVVASIRTSHKNLCLEVQKILANLGIRTRTGKERTLYALYIEDNNSIYKFNKLVRLRNTRNVKKLSSVLPDKNFSKPYEVKIIDIRYGSAICGDISVKEVHSYLCDGYINHNTGKSTCAVFCMIRKIYEISCWQNIPGVFNLMPGSIVAFIYFSLSKTQAELTGYGQIKNIIDQIPYFQDRFKRNERIQSMMVFPENVIFLYGSEQSHSTGLNMLGCILDEANFRQANAQIASKVSTDNEKVETMYTSIINRGASRFMGKGRNSALAILVSSNTTSSSFTEQRKKVAIGNKHSLIINARLWDVKPKGTYDSEGFWVFVGSDIIDAMICDVPEDIYQFTDSINLPRIAGTIEEIIKALPESVRDYYTWAPNDFRKQYEDNLIMSLQDLSGYSVAPSGRLFNSRPAYNTACDSVYTHPFTKNVFVLSTQDEIHLKDYIKPDYYPINRNKPRFLHFDQSLSHDRTGVGSVYCHHWEKDPNTGIFIPYYVNDIQMSVMPPKAPRKISIKKCFELVFYMRDVWGLTIGGVTYDSYASAGAQQELEANGIPCSTLSVDKSDEQYIYLCDCLLNGQIKMYKHPVFEKELFDLIHYRGLRKVDHPKAYYGSGENSNQTWGGSKDLTDGVAGALWNCYVGSKSEQENQGITEETINEYSRFEDEEEVYSMKDLTGGNFDIFREDEMSNIGGW